MKPTSHNFSGATRARRAGFTMIEIAICLAVIGIALVAVVVAHLVFNWSWMIRTTRQVFSRLPAEVRFNHIWDALLFVLFVLTILSGLLVSQQALPSMGIPWVPSRFWMVLHNMSATVLTVMIGVHIAMHLRWVWTRLKR